MYSVVPDHSCKLLRVTMAGAMSPQEVTAFWHDAALARAELKLPLTAIGILIHTPGNVLQSQEVVAQFVERQRMLPIQPCIAIVTEGRLLPNQFGRLLKPGRSGVFKTLADAERWLAAKVG